MAGILDLMGHIQQQGDLGRQQGQARRLGDLYSQALQAPQEQRTGLLAQMAQVSPKAAFDAHKFFGEMQDDRRAELGRYAAAFDALPDDQKAAAYPQLAKQAQELGIPAPSEWRPEFAPNISRLAQALGGGSTGGMVQSTFVDQAGNRVAIMRDGSTAILGQNAPNNQIIDTGNGFFGVNKGSLQAAPVTIGGAPQQQPVQAFMAADGVPVQIDPSLPPNVQASIRQAEASGQPMPAQIPGLVQGVGQQLRSAPKPAAPSEMERRIELAQQMGASPEEVKRMVVGGESARDAQKISAADANKARQKLTQISAARQQLNAVKQAFEKIRDSFSAGIGGNYLPTPEGQAFDRAVRNLAPLITAVTRVPGVGAMSDYESRLQEQGLPSRGTYEQVTEQQIADLERLLNTIESGYTDLIGGSSSPSPETSGGGVDELLSKYGIR